MGFVCEGCNYFIGNTCFSLPSKIQHMSHPHHPLKLTWYADFQNGNLKCPGCQNYTNDSSARAYCCTECNFFIDRFCASAPKILTVEDVSYKLSYSFPFKHEKAVIKCNRCSDKVVTKDSMLYYNLERDETLHVSCALIKESGIDSETRSNLSVQRLNELRIAD
ncbi:hypothetical protein T459_26626 [Capsicum annuum]|uniref:DC1 domain-containing protein n=1 Tax=Capsicum annuum TaxID=4072 RepID=A0A1U8EL13_CAPAN|nr:uncharacterized protein LOC107844707 [Capsicum annuum]PHT71522.1 hypothetical protein T459_26626 [Capsicum annuum]